MATSVREQPTLFKGGTVRLTDYIATHIQTFELVRGLMSLQAANEGEVIRLLARDDSVNI